MIEKGIVMAVSKKENAKAKYTVDRQGRFIIDNYHYSEPFSNFFPGIAGVWGIPMWVFYVNRGQGISSFGLQSKDKAIMEFQPANKAWRSTPLQGFRTFIKVKTGRNETYWEPFQAHLKGTDFNKNVRMIVTAHDLTLEEINNDLGLQIQVNYFTLPDEDYAALVRRVTITNISKRPIDLELVDGLPLIMPYGLSDGIAKHMSRTVEAWFKVSNFANKAPYYHLNVEVSDKPQVTHIKEGHFYFAFSAEDPSRLMDPIIDGKVVFGDASDGTAPELFLGKDFVLPKTQYSSNRAPSAMSYAHLSIPANGSREVVSIVGHTRSVERLNEVVSQVREEGFIQQKARRNQDMINEIKQYALTWSAHSAFDQYSENTFLDNILRGGLPVSLKTKLGHVAFNVFSRKHGDPERDYNYFMVAPTFFSQGNGNYRDVNQNRRNDVWFNGDVRDSHLVNFLNLSQADGYNPLVVKGTSFRIENMQDIQTVLIDNIDGHAPDELVKQLHEGFMPGEVLRYLDEEGIPLKVTPKAFLGHILDVCQKQELAEHGEGFWTDHWTYNLDLLDSYLAVYPENLRHIFLEKKAFEFYWSDHYVLPRDQRYILTANGVRQYASVAHVGKKPPEGAVRLRVQNGKGDVYKTTLIVKLLCLVANKVSTLDPSGIGVEMEADKPNWYDALNGLPGLLGSSVSETFEIKRCATYILDAFKQLALKDSVEIAVFEELALFVSGLTQVLSQEKDSLTYWHKSNDLKERYRLDVRYGISGKEKKVLVKDVIQFAKLVIARADMAVQKAVNKDGFLATYFYHEVTEHEVLGNQSKSESKSYVRPKKFHCHALPLFLEGFVHALRVAKDKKQARDIYEKVCDSGLYDKKLKMFKVNDSLVGETEEIGRTRIFPAGWLENESIWLHMEYKFLLEMLRQGLFEDFYRNSKSVLVPFMKPQVYGRSTLENSSFIVSSAHEDASLHGRGFVARLSGSTAEFMHIWLIINLGLRPFRMDAKNNLILQLQPILTADYFTTKSGKMMNYTFEGLWESVNLPAHTYAFKLFGKTLVVYHNPKRKDTFGPEAVTVQKIILTYPDGQEPITVSGATIQSPWAGDIRSRKVARIDVHLG